MRITVANFNTVFLTNNEEEKPLLEYFDTIVVPAFTSGIAVKRNGVTYLLKNVGIAKDYNDNYTLTGLIVKDTVLEIKSILDNAGNLVPKDEHHMSAPYSIFVIYLRNHRMLFAENQKGSPQLKTFWSVIKEIFTIYVMAENNIKRMNNEELLPIPLVNVVGIPTKENVEKALSNAEKVNQLLLRFYPLNGDGDIDFSEILGTFANELRKKVGSKNGELILKSPQNIQGVADIISQSRGTIEPIIRATFPGNRKLTLKEGQISEKIEVNIKSDDYNENLINIIEEGKNIDNINYISEENSKIYEENVGKIIPFVKI